jgi:hypothetical protein
VTELAIRQRNEVDPDGDLWISVLESTGQARSYCTPQVCESIPKPHSEAVATKV